MTEIAVHEINNVLQWLRMTLDIAGQETKKLDLPQLQTKLVPAVADARLGVEHIADIVRELRDLRRPYGYKPDAFDPTEALRAALAIGGTRIGKRARLVEEIGPLPLVRGRKHDLVCVFLNLLLNAAQAIAPGSPRTNRVCVRVEIDAPWVVVRVSDTGRGLEPALADRIFEHGVTSLILYS